MASRSGFLVVVLYPLRERCTARAGLLEQRRGELGLVPLVVAYVRALPGATWCSLQTQLAQTYSGGLAW